MTMSETTTHHATFSIERSFAAAPAQVFAAWADPAAKRRWFVGPAGKWTELDRKGDFRIGGEERVRGAMAGGPVSAFHGYYFDIVSDRRIVYGYDMHLDDRKISVSLATVEFNPTGDGTNLVFTEQLVYLDGYDDPNGRQRKEGTQGMLDNLEAALRRPV
jgi:uncharacterized protein YndB with AHSA1/START domain